MQKDAASMSVMMSTIQLASTRMKMAFHLYSSLRKQHKATLNKCTMHKIKPYRGYYQKCYDRISLHPKWRNGIDGAKEKTQAVKFSNEGTKIQPNY